MDWRRGLEHAAAATAVLLTLLLVYGAGIEPRFMLDERRVSAEIPGLDESWDGAQVAVFSDLQIDMWLANTGMVERVVDRAVAVDPAAVAGDQRRSCSSACSARSPSTWSCPGWSWTAPAHLRPTAARRCPTWPASRPATPRPP